MIEPTESTTDESTGQTSAPEKIHVAFCLDNNYAEGTGVAAYSLCKNMAPEDEAVIHIVMSEPLQQKHREKFQKLEQTFAPKVEIRIYDDEKHLKHLALRFRNIFKIGHLPFSILIRVALSEILPSTINKVINFDCDILIFTSLRDLWNRLPSKDYVLAGVARDFYDTHNDYDHDDFDRERGTIDHPIRLLPWLRRQHMPIQMPFYINCGMTVWDLFRIRQSQRLTSEIIDFMLRYKPPLTDQDALTIVLRNNALLCDNKWNVCFYGSNPYKLWFDGSLRSREIAVLHFQFHPKPWKIKPYEFVKTHRATLAKYIFLRPPTIWHKYRQESPWRHSVRSRFRELFATPEDRKLFMPIFTGIAAMLVLTTSVSFYYLGRLFF
jgi:lipopolysaccharide biosynthesis glycosyltransferase